MEVARSHWLVAIVIAAIIHAGVATAILWQEQTASARSAGIGGIEVSLGPAGGAAGAQAAVPPPPPPPEDPPPEEQKEEEPPEPEPVVEPEVIEEKVEEVDVAVSQDVLPPEPLPEIVEPIEPIEEKPEPEPEPEPVVEKEPAPEPKPEPEPVVEKKPVVEPPKQVEAPPPPMPKPQPPKPKVVKKPEPAPEPPKPVETQVAMAPPSVSGTEGKAGTQASQNAGNANDSTGGGIPGELVDYMSVLQAWLEKHKEYPRGARLRRIEGTTLLYFVMNKGGTVIDFRIQRSSGFSMLDREVEEMIQRAQPLPQIPDDMKRDRLELVVPVQFMLR